MKDIVLLGAGASVDAGLPTSFGLTNDISRASALPEPGRRGGAPELAAALAFAVGTLYQQRGAAGINPIQKPGMDIEELIEAIDSLAHPETSGLTPFVSGWHPFLRDIDAAVDDRNRLIDDFVNLLDTVRTATSPEAVAEAKEKAAVSMRIALILSQPRFGSVLFRRLKAAVVRRASEILWLSGEGVAQRVEYLAPLLAWKGPECVATLNYDNTIEVCAEAHGASIGIGLEDYTADGALSFRGGVTTRLLKLHGSFDWQFPPDSGRRRDYPGRNALRFSWTKVSPSEPGWDPDNLGVVIGRRKMQAPGPFLDLLQRFIVELSSADRLITLGYSFRDDHINRSIVQFLIGRERTRLLIVDPALPERYEVLADLIERFPGRIRVWNVTAAQALSAYPISAA